MTTLAYKVPRKKNSDSRFAPVWAYLETVKEYETIAALRVDLAELFGTNNTPSKSHLHRHLQQYR